MSDEVICPECPAVLSAADITATLGEDQTTLQELNRLAMKGAITEEQSPGGIWRRLTTTPRRQDPPAGRILNIQAMRRLQPWTFTCPAGHAVDGNPGLSFPLAVLGENASSKSHFLPALIWELRVKRALGSLGINLREAAYTNVELSNNMHVVYESEDHPVLDRTPAGKLLGPYGYRLTIRKPEGEDRYSLLLFDVAGEDLSSIVRIASNAKFVLLCRGLIILLDPVGLLPTEFDKAALSKRSRLVTATRIIAGITRIADVLEEVYGVSSSELGIPISFVVAKADSIVWDFDWAIQTESVLENAPEKGLNEALHASSDAVAQSYREAGGELILDEIADRFDAQFTRFVAASATSEMPQTRDGVSYWSDPTPEGVALALLHILSLSGVVQGPRPASRVAK